MSEPSSHAHRHACALCPPERPRLGKQRRLCQTHYLACLARVHAGTVTWQELAEAGLCTLTPEEQGGKRNILYENRPIRFGRGVKS